MKKSQREEFREIVDYLHFDLYEFMTATPVFAWEETFLPISKLYWGL